MTPSGATEWVEPGLNLLHYRAFQSVLDVRHSNLIIYFYSLCHHLLE